MSATAGGERGQSPLPGLYVAQHYFLDSASSPYRCFKVGSTRDLRARLTHVTFVTCFDSPFRYVFYCRNCELRGRKKRLKGPSSRNTKIDAEFALAAITLS